MGSTVRQCISVQMGDNEVVSFVGSTRSILSVRRTVFILHNKLNLACFFTFIFISLNIFLTYFSVIVTVAFKLNSLPSNSAQVPDSFRTSISEVFFYDYKDIRSFIIFKKIN